MINTGFPLLETTSSIMAGSFNKNNAFLYEYFTGAGMYYDPDNTAREN